MEGRLKEELYSGMRAALSLMSVWTADESSGDMRDGLSKKEMGHILLLLADRVASGHASLVNIRLILDISVGLSRSRIGEDWRLCVKVTSRNLHNTGPSFYLYAFCFELLILINDY